MAWNQTKEKVAVQLNQKRTGLEIFGFVPSYLVAIFYLTASVFSHFSFSQQLVLLFTHSSRDNTAIFSHHLLIDANMQRKQNFTLF